MNNKKEYKKNLKRNIPLLGVISLFSQLRFYYPIAILIYHSVTGSYTMGMTVFAAISASILAFDVPTGILSDKLGRKPILILESVCVFVSVLLLTLSFSAENSLYWLYASAVAYGGAVASRNSNREAIIYETLLYYRRTKNFALINGRMNAMTQAALGINGAIAGVLLWADFSFQQLTLFSLLPLAINVVLSCLLIEPKKHSGAFEKSHHQLSKAVKLLARSPRLRMYAVATTLRNGFNMSEHTFMPSFIASVWPVWATPFYRSGQHCLGSISFWFSGLIVQKFGKLNTLWGSFVFSGVLSFLAFILQNTISPIILFIKQIGFASGRNADATIQQNNFTDKQRSTMGSLVSFSSELITVFSAVPLGYMADVFGPAYALIVILCFKFVPVNVIYAYLFKVEKRETSTRKSSK